MQVLVALYRARGIVTRDELVERCWDGRVVTDDAINRVLSRIRHVADKIGGGTFRVETITRVGYRLVEQAGEQLRLASIHGSNDPRRAASRRTVIAGVVAATVALGAGVILWEQPWRHRPPPEARELYRRGVAISREGMPGQTRQSVSYFERAVAVDPQYAEAWGALALGYSHLLEGFDEAEMASLSGRIHAAARRALELDSDNADAQLALVFITPYFRNWAAKEADLRRVVADHPRHWLAHGRLGMLLYQVGRLSEGIEQHRKALEIEPMLPTAYCFLIRNLTALGNVQEAKTMAEKAHESWPTHPGLWIATFEHLLFSGRPRSAAAFVMDPDSLPSGATAADIEPLLRLTRAIDTSAADAVDAAVADQLRIARADVTRIPSAAAAFAMLGRSDLTFASLDRYFFDRGSFGAPSPIRPYTRRYTDTLFSSPMAAVRENSRFAGLLREVGLEDYWRTTGTVPNYRRAT